jgi:hypothetical protein
MANFKVIVADHLETKGMVSLARGRGTAVDDSISCEDHRRVLRLSRGGQALRQATEQYGGLCRRHQSDAASLLSGEKGSGRTSEPF